MIETEVRPTAIKVQTYPHMVDTPEEEIFQSMKDNFCGLANDLKFSNPRVKALYRCFGDFYHTALTLFDPEERARMYEEPGANLYYHGKPHAVFQAGYDGISITRGILSRKQDPQDKFATHLTTEGALAIVFGTMFHDCGYVTGFEGDCDNYAARTPVHVEQSIQTFNEVFDQIPLPQFLDRDKIKQLASIGIHSTYFPFTPARKQERIDLVDQYAATRYQPNDLPYELEINRQLRVEARKEAMIVALATQLTDLGGQLARSDYGTTGLVCLRNEMDAANPEANMGTIIVGKDEELVQKFRGFLKGMVLPSVGKTAHAFFGPQNRYLEQWAKHIGISLNSTTNFRTLLQN